MHLAKSRKPYSPIDRLKAMRVLAGLAWLALLLGLAACTAERSPGPATTSRSVGASDLDTTPGSMVESLPEFVEEVTGPDPDDGYHTIELAIEAARICWEESGPDDYHLAIEFGGMAVVAPALARVIDGEVVDAYPSTQQWSAEWLFQLVEDIVARRPDVIEVRFDADTCHVTTISVDEETEAVDDEYGYDVHITPEPGAAFGDVSSLPPPVIHLVSGEETTLLHPYDYCWALVCADSFGSQEPDRAEIDDDTAVLLWRGDGSLTADIDHDGCRIPLTLEEYGPGTWTLAIPEQPGENLIHLGGATREGTTLFHLQTSTDRPGPPATPRVVIGWPINDDTRWVNLEIIGYMGEQRHATLTLEGQDGEMVRTTVDLAVVESAACPRLSAEFDIDESSDLESTLIAHLQLDDYKVTFEWPAEFADQPQADMLVRSMTARP